MTDLALGICEAAVTPELLVDGDMEAAGIAAWSVIPDTFVQKVVDPVYSGSRSLDVYVSFLRPAGFYGAYQSVMVPGAQYRLHGYALTPGGAVDPDAQQIRTGAGTTLWIGAQVAHAWEEVDVTFTADHADIILGMLMAPFGFGGSTYYDDFSLTSPGYPGSAWDLLYEGGDLVTISDDDEIKQSLKVALQTGLGEWAFDIAAGVAYRGGWRTRPINNVLIQADVRRVCLGVAGVVRVTAVEIAADSLTREAVVAVEVQTARGLLSLEVTP